MPTRRTGAPRGQDQLTRFLVVLAALVRAASRRISVATSRYALVPGRGVEGALVHSSGTLRVRVDSATQVVRRALSFVPSEGWV